MADDTALSFAEFYARHFRRLLGFAVSAYGAGDGADIAQEAMTRAYAAFHRLDPARDPWPWLTAIARNVARDRWAERPPLPLPEVPARQPDAVAAVEERHVLRAALGRLSSSDRDVLVLRECHDYTFDELASLLGRSENTVRQQAFRARRRLKAAYTSLGGRALGLAGALRWRPWADAPAQVAAAVVAGALVTGGAAAAGTAPGPAPSTRTAIGPAARGNAPAGPAVVRAAPIQPLQPVRAARVNRPRKAAIPVVGTATADRPEPAAGDRPAPHTARVPARGESGVDTSLARPRGNGALCAATSLCQGAGTQ